MDGPPLPLSRSLPRFWLGLVNESSITMVLAVVVVVAVAVVVAVVAVVVVVVVGLVDVDTTRCCAWLAVVVRRC